MTALKTLGCFVLAAMAEICGCYLPYLWLRKGRPAWFLLPAAASLALFSGLLACGPEMPAGRTYAAYGGVYVAVAMLWLWRIDGVLPDRWDCLGVAFTLAGMSIIAFSPHRS